MKSKARYIKLLTNEKIHYFASAIITILFLSLTFFSSYMNHHRTIENERFKAQSSLGVIRARLEGALNSRLLMGQGLASYLSVKPDISEREFTDYAEKLFSNDPMIRNISILKGTTITYAYPIESNRKAIGIDLSKIPEQRESVLKAIETGSPVVIPRVNLVQGGIGTISRIPVYTGSGATKKYWGQISVVLMQDALFNDAGLQKAADLKIYMTSIKEDGSSGIDLFGKNTVEQSDPVSLDILFPHGKWRIHAIPEDGWGYSDSASWKYLLVGSMLSILLGILVFLVSGAKMRIYQLESILPICSNCKRIRNDGGNWSSIEQFFDNESEIKFSHSICPECMEKLYGRQEWYKKEKNS